MTLMMSCMWCRGFCTGTIQRVSLYTAVALFRVHTLSAYSSYHATVTLVQWNASRNNGHFRLSTIDFVLNYKNGCFSSYSLLLGSISTLNYQNDHFNPQFFLVGLISTPELPKCLFQSFFLVHSCSSSYMALGTSLCYALSAPALP